MSSLNESAVEEAALSWFKELRYELAHAPRLAEGEMATERSSFQFLTVRFNKHRS